MLTTLTGALLFVVVGEAELFDAFAESFAAAVELFAGVTAVLFCSFFFLLPDFDGADFGAVLSVGVLAFSLDEAAAFPTVEAKGRASLVCIRASTASTQPANPIAMARRTVFMMHSISNPPCSGAYLRRRATTKRNALCPIHIHIDSLKKSLAVKRENALLASASSMPCVISYR